MKKNYLFTSESVLEGHPDKICDQISDAILDEYMKIDNQTRVACECAVTTNKVIVFGEIRSMKGKKLSNEAIEKVIRKIVKDIGYEQEGFNWKTLKIQNLLHAQSADIAIGVDKTAKKEEGAGDQGMMFGYACKEAPEYMPASIYYCHRLLENISNAIKSGEIKDIGPDGKCQITLEYKDGKPIRAKKVLISIQHKESVSIDEVKQKVKPYIEKTLPKGWMCGDKDLLINPTGRFVIGGPHGDSGLTGRKIIVDTYGGHAPHGGGCFSGKDCTKVDRSGSYMMRYLAKNVVASGVADKCLLQVSYAIGVAEPMSFYVDTLGTGKVSDKKIEKALRELVDLRPRLIRERLQLNKPIYRRTATYGHFGRKPEADGGFSWERLDLVKELKERLS